MVLHSLKSLDLWSSLDPTVISKRDGVFLCAFMFIFVINLHIPCTNTSLFSITLNVSHLSAIGKLRHGRAVISSGYSSEFYDFRC